MIVHRREQRRIRSTHRVLFLAAVGVIAVHVIDDSFVQALLRPQRAPSGSPASRR